MILKSQHQLLRKAEKRVTKRLHSDFVELGKIIEKRLIQEEEKRSYIEDIDELITIAWTKSLSRLGNDLYLLYRLGGRYVNKFVAGEVELDKINILAVKRVEDLQNFNQKNIDGSILHTTINEAKKVIANGIYGGKTYKQIGNEMREKASMGFLSKARAERIAINTVGNAYEQGRKEAVTQIKYKGYKVEKQRTTVGDDRVTVQCRANEQRGWLEFNQARPSGDTEAPRSGNPRCRCTTNYKVL